MDPLFGYVFSTHGSRILDFGTVESLRFSPQRWSERKNWRFLLLQIQPFPDPDHNSGSSYSIFYLHILVLQTISSWRIAELTSIMQESLDCMGDVPCPQRRLNSGSTCHARRQSTATASWSNLGAAWGFNRGHGQRKSRPLAYGSLAYRVSKSTELHYISKHVKMKRTATW